VWDSDLFQECGDCEICRQMQDNPDAPFHDHHHGNDNDSDDSDDSDEFFLAVEDDLGREIRLAKEIAGSRALPPPPSVSNSGSQQGRQASETRF
jgi:hypothetical protein